MTAKEREIILLSAARSAVSQLRWYVRDYDSCEIKDIADTLEEAIKEVTKTKRTTKRK